MSHASDRIRHEKVRAPLPPELKKRRKCPTGKRGYATAVGAGRALREMGGWEGTGRQCRTYLCGQCHQWHLTSFENTPGHARPGTDNPNAL